MIFDAAWKDGLFITACILVGLYILYTLIKLHAKRTYYEWLSNPSTPLDVDGFVDTATTPPNYLKVYFLQRISVGGDRKPGGHTVQLASAESPHIPGLRVTERAEQREGSKIISSPNLVDIAQHVSGNETDRPTPLVIGTIRMGFGHHRIAYAACSWAMSVDEDTNSSFLSARSSSSSSSSSSRSTFFHDLLNVDSPEADLIKSTDAVYSKLSRLTSNMGGFIEKMWGKATLSGDGDSLRVSGLTAVHLRPLFRDLPLDTPIIATHCYVALAAVAAGFTNVVNLVIDNHAQWFVVVPGALNLVQGPANYQNFLKMGVDEANVRVAGHWIPRDLVTNIPQDCARRISRAKMTHDYGAENGGVGTMPRRILIPVGGAGAQRKFIESFIRAMKDLVLQGKVQLFLNAGDHVHMKKCFTSVLAEIGLEGKYNTVATSEGVTAFRDHLLAGNQPETNVTLFSFDTYFPAVATTDILCRVADVLACKPSELAFYPVPKLMIRRVGDHEQYSALRAAELGDGTLEAREIEDAMAYVRLMVNKPDLLVQMNDSIIKNAEIGTYDGCKNAVRIALERDRELKKVA